MRRLVLSAILLALPAAAARAETRELTITIAAGKHDRANEPVCVPLTLPKEFLTSSKLVRLEREKGRTVPCQLTGPSLLAPQGDAPAGEQRCELHFILPELKAGETLTLKAFLDSKTGFGVKGGNFAWSDEGKEHTDLSFDGRPVLSYVHAPLDDSTKEKREATFKVYHHLYTPDGSRLITKGPGGLYTHHRGIFYGFKATYGDKITADTWHCPPPSGDPKKPSLEAHLAHEKILSSEAGPVLGRHRVLIRWHGRDKQLFAREERELTVYNVPGGQLVEFASKLTPVKGTVKVDGDPQHAGFHFRADNEVDANKKETIFIRPDGDGKPGEERSWDPKTQKGPADLPWNGMSFVVGGKRYTAAYLDRPDNPKEARYSERTYGRFGSYFVSEATEKKPLTVRYRLWVQDGQMKGEEIAARSAQFVSPAEATAK